MEVKCCSAPIPKPASFQTKHHVVPRPAFKKQSDQKSLKYGNIFDREFQKQKLHGSKLLVSDTCVHKDTGGNIGNDEPLKSRGSTSKLKCSVCDIELEDYLQQRAHFKTEWHVFNVRQRIQMKGRLDEASFTRKALLGESSDSDFEDGDSAEDELITTDAREDKDLRHHREAKIHFITPEKKIFSLYRSLLDSSKNMCKNCVLHESLLSKVTYDKCWIILMYSGGHFASAVFHKLDVVEHKTIHRYTVRAKRGTSQSTRDSKQNGKAPRSVGATIRRQNEATLVTEIQDLLGEWKEHVDHADKIFLKWPQNSRSILFGGKSPIFERSDRRIRKIPFMTGRPTLRELMGIHRELTTVRFQDMVPVTNDPNTDSNSGSEDDELIGNFKHNLTVECKR